MSQEHCIASNYQGNVTPVYQSSPFYVSPVVTSQNCISTPYYLDNNNQYDQQIIQQQQQQQQLKINSPSSMVLQEPPILVRSSSPSTTSSTLSTSSIDYLNEKYAKLASLPEAFSPEFLQYSKEAYEQSVCGESNSRKLNMYIDMNLNYNQSYLLNDQQVDRTNDFDMDENNFKNLSLSEVRRKIHIQSEQKRRAQIKDGFEVLRNELPTCFNKKMSKVALLHRTVQHIQYLKNSHMSILVELERLVHENEQLRRFQEGVLQKQALQSMCTMTSI